MDGGTDATTDGTQGTDAGNDVTSNDSGTDSATTGPCNGNDAGCKVCCNALHPDAATLIYTSLVACACTNPGTCNVKNVCKGDLCNGQTPGTACETCLLDPDAGTDAGSCDKTVKTQCEADTDCKTFVECLNACPPTAASSMCVRGARASGARMSTIKSKTPSQANIESLRGCSAGALAPRLLRRVDRQEALAR